MKKSQLSDKQLEEILGQMPKIKDNRDPRDIYQNIAPRVEKRRVPAWVIPGAALAAVLFLAFILSPGLMDMNQSTGEISGSKSSYESNSDESMEMDTATQDTAENASDQPERSSLKMATPEEEEKKGQEIHITTNENPYAGLSALYKEELAGQESEILTYAIPDQNAHVLVPVTAAVPKEEGKKWFDSYTETMPKLKEEEWGLSEFYPIDAKWEYEETSKTLNMDVKNKHPFKYGSVSNTMLLDAVAQNLSGMGIQKLTFSTEQKPGIDMGNYGVLKEQIITPAANSNRAYMFYRPNGSDQPFLVPTEEQFKSIVLAFEKMQGNIEELNLTASLPDDFAPRKIEWDHDKNEVRIFLEDGVLDNEFLPNLEAILMTAKDFGYQTVKFENTGREQLGPFNLNEPISVPIAPNKKSVE